MSARERIAADRRRVLVAAGRAALASAAVALHAPFASAGPAARGEPIAGALARLLARRRMVRSFTRAPVSDAQLERVLAAARRAPSAGNTQPWAFVVVRDRKTRALLGRAALGQMFVAEAPVVVVPCVDVARATARYEKRGELYALVDTAFASMLLLLAVTEEHLGACFVGALNEGDVRAALALPAQVRPLAVIPIGHPARRPRAARLRPLGDMLHRERWGGRRQ